MPIRLNKKIIFQSKSLKKTSNYFSPLFPKRLTFYWQTSFPNSLKQLDITHVHKNNDTNDRSNYIPVSILPFLSKTFEKCLYDQIYAYTDSILSKSQCSFRKGCSTQY